MVNFDENGNLIPYSVIPLMLTEVVDNFVTAFPELTARPVLYAHFVSYLTNLNRLLNQSVQQWLGGSFISTKIEPNDIDCVNLIVFSEGLEERVDLLIPYLLIGGSQDTYYVDEHLIAVYSPTDERYEAITIPSVTYWNTFLMKDRQDKPRGIVELIDMNQCARTPSS